MMNRNLKIGLASTVLFSIVLIFISFNNFLLFHTIAELFSILIAASTFLFLISTYNYHNNNFLIRLSIPLIFILIVDLLHTCAYKGMGIFNEDSANLPTQLWILARLISSIGILNAVLFFDRPVKPMRFFLSFTLLTGLTLTLVFLGLFPTCYIDGVGLTAFKIISEYVISGVLVLSGVLLYPKRKQLDPYVYRMISLFLLTSIISEIAFTFYVSVYGLSNLIGHIAKIFSFYFLGSAIWEKELRKPYAL